MIGDRAVTVVTLASIAFQVIGPYFVLFHKPPDDVVRRGCPVADQVVNCSLVANVGFQLRGTSPAGSSQSADRDGKGVAAPP